MQFLRTVFWVVLAVVGVIFSFNNWQIVTIRLWSDVLIDTPLPILLFVVFMLGLLPVLLLHRATQWHLKRKLEVANRNLAETRAAVAPPVPAVPPLADPVPPGAL